MIIISVIEKLVIPYFKYYVYLNAFGVVPFMVGNMPAVICLAT